MSNQPLDSSVPVRSGEELPIEALASFLKSQRADLRGTLTVEQFPGGFSNLTYLLKMGDQELVLRRPPFGAAIKTAHDMEREYRVLSALQPHFPKIPEPLVHCDDPTIIGAPFYVMTRVRGVILRNRLPKGMTIEPATFRGLSEASIACLADLHSVDLATSGLIQMGKPEGYVERQVRGWTKRYQAARTEDAPSLKIVSDWLAANMPSTQRACFIHNDFKYDNLVLNPDQITDVLAVLDWEMATVGDPLMDLGTSLAYWGELKDPDALKPFSLTWMPGNMNRQEVVEHYVKLRGGVEPGELLYYYVFGVYKIAGIAQQIYHRFRAGYTKDPRFGALIYAVKACELMATKALEKDRISQLF
ncbi:MAG: phosphotransferase family protein [Bacteroidota bacterium]